MKALLATACVLLLCAHYIGSSALAADPPDGPQSPAAVSAIRDYEKACKAADDARRQAVMAASRRLIDKLKIAMTAATKAGNLKEANAINAKISEVSGSPASEGPAAPMNADQQQSLVSQRATILADAKAITDPVKRLTKLLEAAKIGLQLDQRAGSAEIESIVKQALAAGNADLAGTALIEEGQFFGDLNNWAKAEAVLARVWKEIRGSYGDRGCQAATIMADHFVKIEKPDAAVPYKLIVIDCGGSYGQGAGDAGLWLAEYHLSKNDKARAIVQLKDVYKNHAGAYDACKKKAREKLLSLGEIVKD